MNAGPSWAQRYGAGGRRLCARPGCGAPAAVTLRFQPTRREAWLVDLDATAARTEGDLCARHAAGLVLPRGWELHNSMSFDLEAARTAEPAPAPAPARPARRARGASIARARRRRAAARTMELPGLSAVADPPAPPAPPVVKLAEPEPEPQPDLVPDAVAEPAPDASASAVAVAVDEETGPRVVPHLGAPESDAHEELAETLDAQTPLLRRAFSNVWPPERDAPPGA